METPIPRARRFAGARRAAELLAMPVLVVSLVGCGQSDAQKAWCDTHATEVAIAGSALGIPPPGPLESWDDWVVIGNESRGRYGVLPSELERPCSAAYEAR